MDDGNKLGLGAAFAALLAGAAHFGDDLFRGAARLVGNERPAASVLGDVAPTAAEGAISSLQAERTGAGPSGDPNLQFGLAVGRSVGDWSRSRPQLVTYEGGAKFKIRFVGDPEVRYSVIDLGDDGSLAGTPLAACRTRLSSSSERGVRQCVDTAFSEMTGCPPGSERCEAVSKAPAFGQSRRGSTSSDAQEP